MLGIWTPASWLGGERAYQMATKPDLKWPEVFIFYFSWIFFPGISSCQKGMPQKAINLCSSLYIVLSNCFIF
jgi:hypothetical protein